MKDELDSRVYVVMLIVAFLPFIMKLKRYFHRYKLWVRAGHPGLMYAEGHHLYYECRGAAILLLVSKSLASNSIFIIFIIEKACVIFFRNNLTKTPYISGNMLSDNGHYLSMHRIYI